MRAGLSWGKEAMMARRCDAMREETRRPHGGARLELRDGQWRIEDFTTIFRRRRVECCRCEQDTVFAGWRCEGEGERRVASLGKWRAKPALASPVGTLNCHRELRCHCRVSKLIDPGIRMIRARTYALRRLGIHFAFARVLSTMTIMA